jgi:hypothetical protein
MHQRAWLAARFSVMSRPPDGTGARRSRIFEIGQRVRHKTRGLKGSVLEVDGGTVYLEASNGVEMQFSAGDLEDDVPAPKAAVATPDPKHGALLARVPESVVGLAAVRFARDPATARRGWDTATPSEKLQWVSRATGLSIEQLAALVNAGKARQIEAHAAVLTGKARGR